MVSEEVIGEMAVKQEKKEEKDPVEVATASAAAQVAETMSALRKKSQNYYTNIATEGGVKTYKCRRCHNACSTTSHSWDVVCSATKRV